MSKCVVFALENATDEPNYERMALLLVKSVKKTNPNVDIYCGIFTNRKPSEFVLERLEDMGVIIVDDVRFTVPDDSINYFLRQYCCHYFGYLTDRYDQVIYLDVDVLVLKEFNFESPENTIIVEQVPVNILELEKPYVGRPKYPLFYNWFTVVTDSNKYVYDIEFDVLDGIKDGDKMVSQRICCSRCSLVHQNVGAYYPKHELKDDTVLFHYDGFIDSGSFWRLKEYNPALYMEYYMYARVLGMDIENDEGYWDVR